MRQQGVPSSAQLKNEEFKKEIRTRMRSDHMKKIRAQFLKLDQLGINARINDKATIEDLMALTTQACNQANVTKMNGIMFQRNYESLLGYVQINLLNKDSAYLINKVQLDDLVALLAIVLSIERYRQIILKQIDMQKILNKTFELISLSQGNSLSIIVWVLFQIIMLFPESVQKISQAQIGLKQKFGLSNLYLSYLICSISELRPDLVRPQIIHQYAQMPINSETDKPFCSNIILILTSYLINYNVDNNEVTLILKWVCNCLSSKGLQPDARSNAINLLYRIIMKHSSVTVITNLINQSTTISLLIGHSLFDSNPVQKQTCIQSLNNLIRVCPNLQLSQLIQQNQSLLQAITSWLSLHQHSIIINSLKSLCKVIMVMGNHATVLRVLNSYQLRNQLEVLEGSRVQEIGDLASAIIEDYMQS